MANKSYTEKHKTQIKGGTVQEAQQKLANKLQLGLARDLLRLFQDSVYCDVKFTVHSSAVLTHSCILRARASRFYTFIISEFEVFEENGISVFNICNASFTYLHAFVENIYTNLHSFHAEDKIIKHLKETKNKSLDINRVDKLRSASVLTPESDLFFTPKCSPSELQKPFASSNLIIKENHVASYYKIASVDDIPVDEKLEENNTNSAEKLLEKELAEQDELFSSFQTILSKKTKIKPNCFSLGASSQPPKKTKPKFNRKFESNLLLLDSHDKKYTLPHWRPNPVGDHLSQREKYLGVKTIKKNQSNFKSQEKVDLGTYLEDPTNSVGSSDMDVSTTAGDSGLEVSSTCQQETSPRENTISETSGVDLTEAINEDIPNDETISTKKSSGSSASSEAGTWDPNDDFKTKSSCAMEAVNVATSQAAPLEDNINCKNQLNEDEINRLNEMEKNIRDCEMFLYMERRTFFCEDNCRNSQDHSMTNDDVPGSLNDIELFDSKNIYLHQNEKQVSNPEECLLGEPEDCQNYDADENYYNHSYCDERNLGGAIHLEDKNYVVDANESLGEGVACNSVNSSFDYFAQPDIVRDVQEAKTPPCTPKKLKPSEPEERKTREPPEESKARDRESSHSTGVSNYFIDASSLLDETEIISPPISLINFKSSHSFEEKETNHNDSDMEETKTVAKKVVSNFYSPASNDNVSLLKENERRQGEFLFKNCIPHYSKHEVNENQSLDHSDRLRGGSDNFNSVDDESEQVVPSADIELSPLRSLQNKLDEEKGCYLVQSNFFDPGSASSEYDLEPVRDNAECAKNLAEDSNANIRESTKDISSSSVSSGSPSLRRRNEFAPILSGGMDFVEDEKKVQKKPSHSQGQAWIVTFDDDKKTRNTSGPNTKVENRGDIKLHSVHIGHPLDKRQFKRKESEFYEGKSNEEGSGNIKTEQWAYPVQKSNSSGYFLDFSKDSGNDIVQQTELKTEKKNMFSMFIGMNDDSNSAILNKSKPVLERESTFDKSLEGSSKESTKSETSEDRKKPFYMFIESDSPNVKRRQTVRRANRETESSAKKNFLRTQSYTIEGDSEVVAENKINIKRNNSKSNWVGDNSLPCPESNFKGNRLVRGKLPLPLNKLRGSDSKQEPKLTVWSETKHPSGDSASSESWLKSKDIQVNYRERGSDTVSLQKDSTFIMDDECQDKYFDKQIHREIKTPERDSGVVLIDKGNDSFVKLSDLDSSDRLPVESVVPSTSDKMSNSNSEDNNDKVFSNKETRLSKSIGSEGKKTTGRTSGLYDKGINRSLSRLFPNLSAQSLARLGRKDVERGESDVQGSEISEVSSSMQSSVEPSGLEISTSETDVSSHVGTTSKLGEDLLKMFLEEISPDIVVEVNGRRIRAHKCILSSRCQYFAAMLSGGWVESAGNVISLQGFSYNAVHFALRHIYSGESRIPESLSVVELATLADMLCLDGLQEIISYNLKVKYCHSFHVPCSVCSVGVIDCLPIAAAYGLDDLYRKCLRWITKYFVKIWPTKSFGNLPKELLEKCYQHYVVHMTVDNVLDTVVNIDKVRGFLPNVRWAESVSCLVNKLHDATVKYIAEHFSSVLTSDNFLALGKEAGWNVSRLEDSLIETVRYLPPEQACWSHARLHRILSVATSSDPPPEMNWNENFLKLLALIAELVENNLIKQAPRAAKSKAWRQMEPELRSRIQEAACLVLPNQDQSSGYRSLNYGKKENGSPNIQSTAKSRNLEIRQIKLVMTQKPITRNPDTNRPLSLQMDQRPKKDSRFNPLRSSVSTSSMRKAEPRTEGIKKTQSRSQISENSMSEPKKTFNPRYSEVKSRYLEPKSPLKNASDKPACDAIHRRTFRYISSSDSSRNCSPALRSSNSRSSIPQAKKAEVSRQSRSTVLRSGSATTLYGKRDRSFVSNTTDTPSVKTLNRLTKEENLSSDSLCTDSVASEKEATVRRKPGKENLGERISENPVFKSTRNYPISRRHSSESWSLATSKTSASRKLIIPKLPVESKPNPPKKLTGRAPGQNIPTSNQCKSNISSPRMMTVRRNQRNAGKVDSNLMNGNANRRRNEVDAQNNKNSLADAPVQPLAVERSGTFLKDEPTILKKPQVGTEA